MSKKSIIISVVIAIVIAVSVAIYFIVKNNKAKNATAVDRWADIPTEPTVFPLQMGSRGKAVEIIQIQTDAMRDGVFGTQTQGCVLQYYGSKIPFVTKDNFLLILTTESGIYESDFNEYYTPTNKAYQYVTVMAGEEIKNITYQDYIALAQKVFGLQPSDFNF